MYMAVLMTILYVIFQEAGPSSHFVRNHCEHGFVWNTPAACPVVAGGTDSGSSSSTDTECKAVNPATG